MYAELHRANKKNHCRKLIIKPVKSDCTNTIFFPDLYGEWRPDHSEKEHFIRGSPNKVVTICSENYPRPFFMYENGGVRSEV